MIMLSTNEITASESAGSLSVMLFIESPQRERDVSINVIIQYSDESKICRINI